LGQDLDNLSRKRLERTSLGTTVPTDNEKLTLFMGATFSLALLLGYALFHLRNQSARNPWSRCRII
jgi:hypothetical protein